MAIKIQKKSPEPKVEIEEFSKLPIGTWFEYHGEALAVKVNSGLARFVKGENTFSPPPGFGVYPVDVEIVYRRRYS